MNRLRFDLIFRVVFVLGIAFNINVKGQSGTDKNSYTISGDSLTLAKIISTVVQTHPSVKEMIEAITSADAGVGLAKSGYYPNADAEASYTRLGPASELSIPHLGSFELYPVNNYSVSVNVEENIYDFGKTAKNVAIANEVKNLSTLSVEQVKQKLASMVTYLYSRGTDSLRIMSPATQRLATRAPVLAAWKDIACLSAALDAGLGVRGLFSSGITDDGILRAFGVATDVYFLCYVLAARRVHDTFCDFPAPLEG